MNFFQNKKNFFLHKIKIFSALLGGGCLLVILSILFLKSYKPNLDILKLPDLSLKNLLKISEIAKGGKMPEINKPVEIPKPVLPELKGELAAGDKFTAKSILVKDNKTGIVLYNKNEYDGRSIASITKLMSALVVLEYNPDWKTVLTVTEDKIIDPYLTGGVQQSIEELWNTALIGSSNKAILTLANAIYPTPEAFVERMNQKAIELGMGNTKFVEPTGLSSENISTASDLAILIKEAMKQDRIKQAVNTKEYNLKIAGRQKSQHLWNTNWLLLNWIPNKFEHFIGGKTGYIDASGYNFVMELSDENNNIIDVIVLGANSHESRFTEARDVAMEVFDKYVWPGEQDSIVVATTSTGE